MKIVVIGGTGRIGSKVVARLRSEGHDVVAAAPSTGVDILSGEGVAAAMAGARLVIDLANSPSFEDGPAMDFFRTAGRVLLTAEVQAGVGHHVALSVVNTDKLQASGYFRAKAMQEQLIRDSGIPYTIIHSTQFFEFLPAIVQSAVEGGTVRVPTALIQPIASEDVADAVAHLALQAPANGIVEIGGPEPEPMAQLVQRFMTAIDDPREVIADPDARYYGLKLDERSLVPAKAQWIGRMNFERWLEQSEFAGYEHAHETH